MFTCVNGTPVQILTPEERQVGRLIDEVKVREFEGWSFDRAEASFELLVKRVLKEVCPFSSFSPPSYIHFFIPQHICMPVCVFPTYCRCFVCITSL
jgi:hypothetical protein